LDAAGGFSYLKRGMSLAWNLTHEKGERMGEEMENGRLKDGIRLVLQ
jgi:hypothetical protein